MSPPLDDHGAAALLTLLVGLFLEGLHVFHVLLRALQIHFEFSVELAQSLSPANLSFLDFIEFFFHARGVLNVKDVGKTGHQQITDDETQFRGNKLPLFFNDVLTVLDSRQNRGVGGRPSDAFFFEGFDECSLGETRRGLSKMLFRNKLVESQDLAFRQDRQLVLEFLVLFVLLVLAFRIDLQKAIELQE